ncbi:MAG: hypothetical protein V7K48_10500 [Nostoc sp.]|uniref:hypothetical protein n=1 Tax=Nostoc sp. TaxID=1180 RepID=UPI002FF4CF1B
MVEEHGAKQFFFFEFQVLSKEVRFPTRYLARATPHYANSTPSEALGMGGLLVWLHRQNSD